MKYGNRSIGKRLSSSYLTIVVLLFILVLLARAAWNIRQKTLLGEEGLTQVQTELVKLEERKRTLAGQVDYLSTEQGIEAELRTKYRAVKEGESVAVILDDKNQVAALAASNADSGRAGLSWWEKLLRFVGL